MRSFAVFLGVCALILIAYIIGAQRSDPKKPPGQALQGQQQSDEGVPHIGSVQVLNACGIDGAAGKVADHLRAQDFDVKEIGNAQGWDGTNPAWHYPYTIVVSQVADLSNARRAARVLATDKIVLKRVDNSIFDVVVYVGPDWEERIK